jgi:hypothetical protein
LDKSGPVIHAASVAIRDLVYHEAKAGCVLCRAESNAAACCERVIDTVASKYESTYDAVYQLSRVHDELIEITHTAGVCK